MLGGEKSIKLPRCLESAFWKGSAQPKKARDQTKTLQEFCTAVLGAAFRESNAKGHWEAHILFICFMRKSSEVGFFFFVEVST